MTVYVEDCRIPWRGLLWGHMMADTLTELHGMAQKIGLRRRWFQDENAKHPHYDIVDKYRSRAIYNGAIPVKSCLIAIKEKREKAGEQGVETTDINNQTHKRPSAPATPRPTIGYCQSGRRKRIIATGELVTLRTLTGAFSGMSGFAYWDCEHANGSIINYKTAQLKAGTDQENTEDTQRLESARKATKYAAEDARQALKQARKVSRASKMPKETQRDEDQDSDSLWAITTNGEDKE